MIQRPPRSRARLRLPTTTSLEQDLNQSLNRRPPNQRLLLAEPQSTRSKASWKASQFFSIHNPSSRCFSSSGLGKDFFKGLVSPLGIKANILALVAVLAGAGVALLSADLMGFGVDFAAGIFAGSMTSTASLQAAMGAAGNQDPAVANQLAPTGKPDIGYAIIFPGVGTIVKVVTVQVMIAMSSVPAPPG